MSFHSILWRTYTRIYHIQFAFVANNSSILCMSLCQFDTSDQITSRCQCVEFVFLIFLRASNKWLYVFLYFFIRRSRLDSRAVLPLKSLVYWLLYTVCFIIRSHHHHSFCVWLFIEHSTAAAHKKFMCSLNYYHARLNARQIHTLQK